MTNDKTTRSFYISEANDKFCEEHDNASALVERLLTQYRKGTNAGMAGIELRLKQKRREYREQQERTERVGDELAELERLRDDMQAQESADLAEARQVLANVERDPSNEAVQHWAEKLGVTPTDLLNQLDEPHDGVRTE